VADVVDVGAVEGFGGFAEVEYAVYKQQDQLNEAA
jgi:adenylate cyclase class IV